MFNLGTARNTIIPLMLMLMFGTAFACGAGNNAADGPVYIVDADAS